MFRILMLGGLRLEPSERTGVEAHVRLQGLALLARLAVAGERGVSREKLVGCFWPEKDERSALHSLSQALHRLRAELAGDAPFLGTRILRLNPAHFSSDVADFEQADRRGNHESAVALYGGPFLDGIFLGGAPEFERWAEQERRRLAERYVAMLRRMANDAAAIGDHECAIEWRRRLLAIDPLDGHTALGLAQSLLAIGDEAGARREAQLHQTLVRAELHRDPDSRITSLIASLPARGAARAEMPAATECRELRTLTADELCARARQAFFTFAEDALLRGIRYGERAIQLSPRHAQAHATLGWLYILLSQATRNGNPRARGLAYVRRAGELDPRLPDVSLALAWIAQLDERFEEAEAQARIGISLDPTFPFAYYILGWSLLNYGVRTGRWDKRVESVAAFATALRAYPRDAHSLLGLSWLYVHSGQYEVARCLLERAAAFEATPAGEIPMIAAATLLGVVHTRRNDREAARDLLEEAATRYANAPQIFVPYVMALTHAARGDLERFAGRYDEAVADYSRARALLDRRPELIGAGYLAVRLETRLAGSFRRLRMRPEEERHAGAASRLTASRDEYSFNWCWGVSEAELHYDWAVYHAMCAERAPMLLSLGSAIERGWREPELLSLEPAFAPFAMDSGFDEVRRRAAALPPLPVVEDLIPG